MRISQKSYQIPPSGEGEPVFNGGGAEGPPMPQKKAFFGNILLSRMNLSRKTVKNK